MKKTEKSIFSPLKLSHMELKNRLIRSATWEGIASLIFINLILIYTIQFYFQIYKLWKLIMIMK